MTRPVHKPVNVGQGQTGVVGHVRGSSSPLDPLPDWWAILNPGSGIAGTFVNYGDIRFPISNAVAPGTLLPVCYGAVRVGGTVLSTYSPFSSDFTSQGLVIVWCEGEIGSIDSFLCNGHPLSQLHLADTGFTMSREFGHYMGADSDPHTGGHLPTALNVACTEIQIYRDPSVGGMWWALLPGGQENGIYEWAADVHGLKLYDPRGSGSTAYSNNPVLIARDLLTRYGSLTSAEIDDVSFAAAADAAYAAGFTCNVAWAQKTPLTDALAIVLQTCNGKLIETNGKTGIYLDLPQAGAPVMTLLEENGDIWGLNYEWLSARDRYTRVAVSFANSASNYKLDQTPDFDDPGIATGTVPIKAIVINAPGVNTLAAAVLLRDYIYNAGAINFRISGTMNTRGITLQEGQKIHLTTLRGVNIDCLIVQIASDQSGFFQFVVKPYNAGVYGTVPLSQGPPIVIIPPNPTTAGGDITVTDETGTRQVTASSASNTIIYNLYQLITYTLPVGGTPLKELHVRGFRGTGAGSKTWDDMVASERTIELTGNEPPPDASHLRLSVPGVVKTIETLTFDSFGRLQNTTTVTGPTRIIIKTATSADALSTGVTVDVAESTTSVDEGPGGVLPPADIGRAVIFEVPPIGVIDGTNPNFTLSHTPSSARILLIADAMNVWGGVDYTRIERDIHFTGLANKPSKTLFAVYPYGQPPDTDTPEAPPPHGTAATWAQGTAPEHDFKRIAFSPELNLFASFYQPLDGSVDVVATSPDGETWTEQTTPAGSSLPWGDICWTGSQFLIVCKGTITPGKTLTSPDGVDWTLNTISGLTGYQEMGRVLWMGSYYLAMKNGGGCDTFTSDDGLAWVEYSSIGQAPEGVCYSPELGMLVAVKDDWIMTSVDGGATWTHQTDTPTITQGPKGAAWSSDRGLFVTCANDQFLTSPDGVHWTERTSSHTGTYGAVEVVWSHARQLFIAIGSTIRTSPDGVTWTEQTCANDQILTGIAVDEGRDIIVVIGNCSVLHPNNVFRSLA